MLTDLVENSLGWFWSKTISLGHNNVGFLFGGAVLASQDFLKYQWMKHSLANRG